MNPKYKCNKANPMLGSKLNSETVWVDSFLEAHLPWMWTFLVKNNFRILGAEEILPLSQQLLPLMSRALENTSLQQIYSEILYYTEGRRARWESDFFDPAFRSAEINGKKKQRHIFMHLKQGKNKTEELRRCHKLQEPANRNILCIKRKQLIWVYTSNSRS